MTVFVYEIKYLDEADCLAGSEEVAVSAEREVEAWCEAMDKAEEEQDEWGYADFEIRLINVE